MPGSRKSHLVQQLRRWYNAVDGLFDRRALTRVVRDSRSAGPDAAPVTARRALGACFEVARSFDRGAQLKTLVSPAGSLFADGTAARWEFFFDLPDRRAQLVCDWSLPWNEQRDAYEPAVVEFQVRPFPPPGSVTRQMVEQGQLLRAQLVGAWKAEMRRRAPLPGTFRDSDEIVRAWVGQGLDLATEEITVTAECQADGEPLWFAQGRERAWRAAL